MIRRVEIDTILAQVTPWPMEERVALAYEILRVMRCQPRQPSPRRTLQQALGIAGGTSAPPDDAAVRQWMAEHRIEKQG